MNCIMILMVSKIIIIMFVLFKFDIIVSNSDTMIHKNTLVVDFKIGAKH
jgi:hypothetical protein